jgi:hypothetical protein
LADLLGVPDPMPPTWCEKCGEVVVPDRSNGGRCPTCKRAVKGSFISKRHPYNAGHAKANEKHLREDFVGAMIDSTFKKLAAVEERARTLTPGSVESQRLATQSREHVQTLTGLLALRPQDDPDMDVVALTDDELISRLERALSQAIADRDARLEGLAAVAAVTPAPVVAAATADDPPAAPLAAPEPSPVATPADPMCLYCGDALADCAQRKIDRLGDWQLLHWNDPEEIDRRARAFGAEMMESLRRGTRPQW